MYFAKVSQCFISNCDFKSVN